MNINDNSTSLFFSLLSCFLFLFLCPFSLVFFVFVLHDLFVWVCFALFCLFVCLFVCLFKFVCLFVCLCVFVFVLLCFALLCLLSHQSYIMKNGFCPKVSINTAGSTMLSQIFSNSFASNGGNDFARIDSNVGGDGEGESDGESDAGDGGSGGRVDLVTAITAKNRIAASPSNTRHLSLSVSSHFSGQSIAIGASPGKQ